MSNDNYPDYWSVTLGWIPLEGEQGCYAEASMHIDVTKCETAEQAIALCREWRGVGRRVLHAIDVKRMGGTEKPLTKDIAK